ncbi:MAG: hypothetical protein WEF86_07000 [Gemmatimonadota bacterium]
MANEGQKRNDPGDMLRDGVRAATGILGAFKDAIEQTFNDLSERGDISPDRARDAARDAMKRAQDSVEDMRGRLDFVPRREFEELKAEIAALRAQVERHAAAGGTGSGTAGGGVGDGSPGVI